MESFKINSELEVICEWKKTRVAFKHVATLLRNGREVTSTKICYLNRTWEHYTYESVLYKLLEKSKSLLQPDEIVQFKTAIVDGEKHDSEGLKAIAMVAKLGDIFHADKAGGTITTRNDWKARMLKAGLGNSGLIMPDDWDSLPEEVKEARLNGALSQLK